MSSWDWSVLVEAGFHNGSLTVAVGPIIWLMVIASSILWGLIQKPWFRWRNWHLVEISPNFFNTEWKIVRNTETAQLAHEAYVELITRKAAIPFDDDHDVLVEVYDSWSQLFGEIRRLARRLSADAIARNQDLRKLHDLLVDTLNKGLRPHLTRWQSRFRRWYATAIVSNTADSPQDIQREFPQYAELVSDLKSANELLRDLATQLRRLSYGD